MREADVAIRMHAPKQPDLVQRHLMSLGWHVCAAPDYLRRHGTPASVEELNGHRLILFGDYRPPASDMDWLADLGRRPDDPNRVILEVNSLQAMLMAVKSGLGIAALPDYMAELGEADGLTRILPAVKTPRIDVYFVYPDELRSSKRVAVFRDFLLARLQQR